MDVALGAGVSGGLGVLWEWLDSILECFSSLNDSMVPHIDNKTLELESVGNVTWHNYSITQSTVEQILHPNISNLPRPRVVMMLVQLFSLSLLGPAPPQIH